MGGSRLEVFKFGLYVFVPVGAMYAFNRPDLAERFWPRTGFYPPPETLHRPPATVRDAEEAYRELRARRNAAVAAVAAPASAAAAPPPDAASPATP